MALTMTLALVGSGVRAQVMRTVEDESKAGEERARATLCDIGRSLRPLTPEEWRSIAAMKLGSLSAEEGESLEPMSEPAGSVLTDIIVREEEGTGS